MSQKTQFNIVEFMANGNEEQAREFRGFWPSADEDLEGIE